MFQQTMFNGPINYWFGTIDDSGIGTANNYQENDDKPLAKDSNGNLFVISVYQNNTSGIDWGYIQKINIYGTVVWSKVFTNGYWQPKQIVVDSSGNVYVAGKTANNSPNTFLFKFDNDGNQLWGKVISITSGTYSYPIGLCVSQSGNTVFLTFEFWTGAAYRSGIASITASAGALNWMQHTLTNSVRYTDITTDASDNIYVCGLANNVSYQGIILKFNSSGTQQWGVGAANLTFSCLSTYAGTHIIAAGSQALTSTGYWVAVAMSTGNVSWQRNYTNASSFSVINDIYVDSNSVIYLAGGTWSPISSAITAGLLIRISGANGFEGGGSSCPPIVFYQDSGSNDGYYYGVVGNSNYNLGQNSYGKVTMLGLNGSPSAGVYSQVSMIQVPADWSMSTSSTITYPYNGMNFALKDDPSHTVEIATASYSSGFTYTYTVTSNVFTDTTAITTVTGMDLKPTPLAFDPSKLS